MTIFFVRRAAQRLIFVLLTLRGWFDRNVLARSGYPPYFSVPRASLGYQLSVSDWKRFVPQHKVIWGAIAAACVYGVSFWVTLQFL